MLGNGLLPGGPRTFNSRALVDACIPYELKSRGLFPPVVEASPALKQKVEAKCWDVLR